MARKLVTMTVTVSAPSDCAAASARREVRELINNQCNWSLWPEDIRVRKIRPAKMEAKR